MDGAATDVNLFTLFRPAGILPGILVFAMTYLLVRVTSGGIERLSAQFTEFRLALQQTKAIVRLALALSGLGLGLSLMVSLTNETLLAFAGTIAVAVGFALKDTASSLMAGILILFDQPFQVGDRVQFGDTYGEVKDIGLRSVRIVTLDDNEVSIPNNKFLTETVASANSGALDMMVVVQFHIAMSEDFELAKRLVYEACITSKYVYLDKKVTILLKEEVTSIAYSTVIVCKA